MTPPEQRPPTLPPDLNRLDHLDEYVRLFTDAAFFRPALEEICRRHALAPCARLRVGLPGTCPVFILEERWLVKLFGRLFDGARSYEVERAAAQILAAHPRIPTPALLASGRLALPAWIGTGPTWCSNSSPPAAWARRARR